MKLLLRLACVFSLFAVALRAQPKPGIIQIKCEPGVLVFLDGELKGETTAELGGMILRGVAPGQHTLRFAKEGFTPNEGKVVVPAGGVVPFAVSPFARDMKVQQRGEGGGAQVERKTGRLLVQSLPIECRITIDGLNLSTAAKTQDEWELASVPTGEYDIRFLGAGRELREHIVIREQALTHLFVDFLEGKIEDRSPPAPPTAEEKATAAARAAAAKSGPLAVTQKNRPRVAGGEVAPPVGVKLETPEEIIQKSETRAAQLVALVDGFDKVLAAGTLGLDETVKAGTERKKLQDELGKVREEIARQQAIIAAARERAFRADYGKLQEVLRGDVFPEAAKRAAWADLAKKWAIVEAPTEPRLLEWRDGKPVVIWTGRLVVESTPPGARITVRGPAGVEVEPGNTPREYEPPEGDYTVSFTLDGYKAATASGRVTRDRTTRVVVALEELPLPKAGKPWTAEAAKVDLLWIAPGQFAMGSTNGGLDERKVTKVTLTRGYWLGKTEVTQAQWTAMMGNNPSARRGETLPVENVSWEDAMAFCRKLTEREQAAGRLLKGHVYTLPTEAQWEYACRAGTTGDYAGKLDDLAWYSSNAGSQTHAVATKQANAWGLHDMHGNVWEWCLDWYGDYPGGSVSDPKGSPSGSNRVYRGGGWGNDAAYCRSAVRNWLSPGFRFDHLGFRLALSASP